MPDGSTVSSAAVRCVYCTAWGWKPPDSSYQTLGFDGPACGMVDSQHIEHFLFMVSLDRKYPTQASWHHAVRETFDLPCDEGCVEPSQKAKRHTGLFDRIKAALPTTEIAQRLTPMRQGAAIWSGKCPLHSEANGESFKVFVDSQRWQCFGACQAGGDVIDLIEHAERAGLTWRKNNS